jgi:hypothetical protein
MSDTISDYGTITLPEGATPALLAISDSGEVVGTYLAGSDDGFVDAGGTLTQVNLNGAEETFVSGVNASGDLVGYSVAGDGTVTGFEGQPNDLMMLPGAGLPVAVNEIGEIVGDDGPGGFSYVGGVYATITAPGATSTTIAGLTDTGVIAGSFQDASGVVHGFVDAGGTFSTIDPAGSVDTTINGINGDGSVFGSYDNSSGNTIGFVRIGSTFTTIEAPGSTSTIVTGVDDAGLVVGQYEDASGIFHGFVEADGTFQTFDPAGSASTQVIGVNNEGEMVGSYADGSGDDYVFTAVVGATPACYVRGTMILAEFGELAVEDLRIGDRVVTVTGASLPVRWIGRREYYASDLDDALDLLPIRICVGALGLNMPHRDLYVSPEHCMLIDGAMIPARNLINGTTITQPGSGERVGYYHLELDSHEAVYAEGAPSETYIDRGNRTTFENVDEFYQMYDHQPPSRAFFAPLLESGKELQDVRLRIAGRL